MTSMTFPTGYTRTRLNVIPLIDCTAGAAMPLTNFVQPSIFQIVQMTPGAMSLSTVDASEPVAAKHVYFRSDRLQVKRVDAIPYLANVI